MRFQYYAARVNEHDPDSPSYWGIFGGDPDSPRQCDWVVDDDYGLTLKTATAVAALFQVLWPNGWGEINHNSVAHIMRGVSELGGLK